LKPNEYLSERPQPKDLYQKADQANFPDTEMALSNVLEGVFGRIMKELRAEETRIRQVKFERAIRSLAD